MRKKKIHANAHTQKEYKAMAKLRGIKWIGELPPNCDTKTEWQCKKDHTWFTTYGVLQQGSACPMCAEKISFLNLEAYRKRNTAKDYKQVSNDSNWKLTGSIPEYATDKTEWTCKDCNTKKMMTLTYVKQAVSLGLRRCFKCRKNTGNPKLRHSNKNYNSLAMSAGLKWKGTEIPRNVRIKTEWLCPKCKGTELRTYDSVRLAPRCLECGRFVNGKRVSGVQVKLAKFLKAELNYKVGDRYIDCAFPDKKIAIEYDSYYYHGDRDDRPRNKEILEAGWKLWRIRSNWAIPKKHIAEYAINQLVTTDRTHFVTTLKDWGRGPLWHQIKEKD